MKNNVDKYKEIGRRIKENRVKSGLSQSELAERVGFQTATAISLIESGDRSVSITDLETIAKTLQVDVNYLLGHVVKKSDIGYALRADKDLTAKDKEQVIRFIDFIKKNRNGK